MGKPSTQSKSVNWLFGKNGALFRACTKGNLAIAQDLVGGGANVKLTSAHGYTPLHRAAQYGHAEIVEFLLDKGADPTIVTTDGTTAQSLAEQHGHAAIAQRLSEEA